MRRSSALCALKSPAPVVSSAVSSAFFRIKLDRIMAVPCLCQFFTLFGIVSTDRTLPRITTTWSGGGGAGGASGGGGGASFTTGAGLGRGAAATGFLGYGYVMAVVELGHITARRFLHGLIA